MEAKKWEGELWAVWIPGAYGRWIGARSPQLCDSELEAENMTVRGDEVCRVRVTIEPIAEQGGNDGIHS